MNIDELKQSLTAIAAEARPEATTPVQRIDAVDHKVRGHRRNTAVGTVAAAAVAIAAVALAPVVLDTAGDTPPADNEAGGALPTVSDHGVSFYQSPGGATLIAHAVAAPGAHSASVTFTPTTTDLSWTDFCYDAGVRSPDGAEYWFFINDHRVTGSSCQGVLGAPLGGEATFDSSPAVNARQFERYGVVAGRPSTLTVRLTKHVERAVSPQPGIAVYARGPQLEQGGVWFERELVYRGHTYRLVGSDVADLDGQQVVRAQVDLPVAEHPLYVVRGAANVSHGLQLFPDSVGVDGMGQGVTGSGGGELVSGDRHTALVRAHPRNAEAAGQVYVLVYERID